MLEGKSVETVQTANTEMSPNTEAYRAPRLVPLGTAVDLVQCGVTGRLLDNCSAGNNRDFRT
jgi:hypothetical protein